MNARQPLLDALRAAHEYDAAIAELNRALALDATLSEVHYNFGRLYAEQARGVEARGLENLNRKLQLLERAQQSFTRFRDVLGPGYAQHARHDDVHVFLHRNQLADRSSVGGLDHLHRGFRQARGA